MDLDRVHLAIHNAGRLDLGPGDGVFLDRFPATYYKLVLVENGSLVIRGTVHRPGSVLLFHPERAYPGRVPGRTTVLQVCFDLVAQELTGPAVTSRHHAEPDRPQPSTKEILGVDLPLELPAGIRGFAAVQLGMIKAEYWRDPGHHLRALSRLQAILAELLIHHLAEEPADVDDPLLRAEAFARNLLPNRLTVTDMARSVGMSREHFARRYRRERGSSPGAFISHERMRIARDLLVHEGISVEKVAKDLKYASAANFARAFKAYYGCTPRRMARQRG